MTSKNFSHQRRAEASWASLCFRDAREDWSPIYTFAKQNWNDRQIKVPLNDKMLSHKVCCLLFSFCSSRCWLIWVNEGKASVASAILVIAEKSSHRFSPDACQVNTQRENKHTTKITSMTTTTMGNILINIWNLSWPPASECACIRLWILVMRRPIVALAFEALKCSLNLFARKKQISSRHPHSCPFILLYISPSQY